jgi:CRP/FNR family transcriptional regulator
MFLQDTDGDDVFEKEILANTQIIRLEPGQFAFRSGDNCTAYLVLLNGSVRVQLMSDEGREITLYRIGSGNSCILTTSCLLSHEDYPAEAIAESAVEAIAISQKLFQTALDKFPRFREHVFDGFSNRLTNVIARISELAFTSIDARLASALLELDLKGEVAVTHQQLGVELGTAREVVSRHLKRFESEGWVRLGRGQVAVTDAERLQRICNPTLCD